MLGYLWMLRSEAARLARAWVEGGVLWVSDAVFSVAVGSEKFIEKNENRVAEPREVLELLTSHNAKPSADLHALYGFEAGVAHQKGAMLSYFARLDAAEKVCKRIERCGLSDNHEISKLLRGWRKAKEASEK